MALIHCPECGKEISSFASACPGCGRAIQSAGMAAVHEPPQAGTKHKKWWGYLLVAAAFALLTVTVIILTGTKYRHAVDEISYYKSQYELCVSKSYGYLGTSYRNLAYDWKAMTDSLQVTIWTTRLLAILSSAAAVQCIVFGIRLLRRAKNVHSTGEEGPICH